MATILFAILIQVMYDPIPPEIYEVEENETWKVEIPVSLKVVDMSKESIPYFKDRAYFMDRNQPVVCLHESPNTGYELEIYKRITIGALTAWTDKIKERSGTGELEWYIHFTIIKERAGSGIVYTDQFKYCDINIIFDNSTPLDITTGSYPKGGTWHYTAGNHWSDIKIYTWDYLPIPSEWDEERNMNVLQYEAVLTSEEVLQQVLEHELGHSFGLHHHMIDGEFDLCDCYDKKHAMKSIMYYATPRYFDEGRQIQDIDVDAIIWKYGTDGWGGWFNEDAEAYYKN
jgi:hypothetical protein